MTKQPCLQAENEQLRADYDAARLEIASLRERVQQLGQLARDVNSRRVTELEVQLAAVGAGGVEPLRKRCLHQITEPDHFAESVISPIDAFKAIAVESAVFAEIQKGIDASHPAAVRFWWKSWPADVAARTRGDKRAPAPDFDQPDNNTTAR